MSSKDDAFLEEARLGPRARVLVECEEIPNIPRLRRRFREYVLTDLAHAVMLTETGIVASERGAKLLEGLLEMYDSGGTGFPYLPDSGSFLVQTEHYLAERIGEDIAGRLQTGRSRNDQSAAAERLYVRDLILDVAREAIHLQGHVLAQAEAHAETLMPGYTHLQHAQPTTFGHHMMRCAAAFDRDLERLRDAFPRVNLSSLGGAAMAGTSWPMDRERTAELLGHHGIVVNSSDAGGFARDYIEEAVAVLSILMSNLGRLAGDLYVWHSWEFGYLEVADGLAGTSSIMPQKKNPHSLERVKALAGQAAGWFAGVMACQHGVVSTDLDFTFADDLLSSMGERHASIAQAVRGVGGDPDRPLGSDGRVGRGVLEHHQPPCRRAGAALRPAVSRRPPRGGTFRSRHSGCRPDPGRGTPGRPRPSRTRDGRNPHRPECRGPAPAARCPRLSDQPCDRRERTPVGDPRRSRTAGRAARGTPVLAGGERYGGERRGPRPDRTSPGPRPDLRTQREFPPFGRHRHAGVRTSEVASITN